MTAKLMLLSATLPSETTVSPMGFVHEIQPRFIGECSIRVGDTEITPAAPHLFGLMLALTLDPRDVWTRRGLAELLFAGTPEEQSSHRLRQLLYRLRAVGVAITEQADGLLGLANPIGDVCTLSAEKALQDANGRPAGVLAHYAPRLPTQFLDWLDTRRETLQQALTARRVAELRAARERQDWSLVARLAAALQQDDLLNEELVAVAAEANAMLGERDAALETIDQFVRESEDGLSAWPRLKRMRARILATRIPKREGTLRGRSECLAFLNDQWERATGGDGGRACAVFGPPGMGKSRVGETFASAIRLAGGQVLTHRCDEQNRQSPLALFARLVRDSPR
jgi:DNA-binding SARP family transcriptional activator